MPSLFSRIRSWFRRPEPEPDVRRNLILFDVTNKTSLSIFTKRHLCQILYEKAVERGLAASHVDFEMYIHDRLQRARKFGEDGRLLAEMSGMPELEETRFRLDIMWLMRNRDRLMRDAFTAGGDAEYVFMQFQGNPEDLFLSMDFEVNKRLIKVHYLAHEDTNLGNYVVVDHGGMSTPFRMPEDAWSDSDFVPILNHIVRICGGR